jgi:hypothetical protein
MRPPYRIAALLVVIVPIVSWAIRQRPVDPRLLPSYQIDRSSTYSNILPDDYVGPQTCAQCHPKQHRLWSVHPHRRMNQVPSKETVRGNFNDQVLHLPTGDVHFTTEADGYHVTTQRDGKVLRRWHVTRTVGTRYIQFYIGTLTEGPELSDSVACGEHMVPLCYWFAMDRWLPKHYFDPDGPELLQDGTPQTQGIDQYTDIRPWTGVCLSCHNTLPYAYRAVHKLYAGFPNATVSVAVGPLANELLPTVPVRPSLADFEQINMRLSPDEHLVTLGISCESCHFGGREHAFSGGVAKISFVPRSPFLKLTRQRPDRVATDDRKSAATINGICTQCHSGNALLFPTGCAEFNSREGLDFNLGACSSQMSCVHCHEPHTAGPPEGAPTSPAHIAACIKCHAQYGDEKSAVAHGRHAATTGVTCLDCHMPRQTLGIDSLVRTHRVAMPVEDAMVTKNLANACNLCHLDKSLRWTATELERGWGKRLTLSVTEADGVEWDRPMGEVWLTGTHTGMRRVAAETYARSPWARTKLPDLIRALNDPEPINRVMASRAVEKVWGKKLRAEDYEMTAPPNTRARQIARLLGLCVAKE